MKDLRKSRIWSGEIIYPGTQPPAAQFRQPAGSGLDSTVPRPEDRVEDGSAGYQVLAAAVRGGGVVNDVAAWIVIFILGLIGLNWPLLEIFHAAPFTYLLVFWLFFMLLVARVSHKDKAPPAP